MSIDLIGISHSRPAKRGKRVELRDIHMHIEEQQRVAILGKAGGGLDELLNIICGAVTPARGNVVLTSEISWPIGETGFLLADASLVTNLRFIARIYEIDENEYVKRMTEVGEIENAWNETFGSCGKDIKWRFAFALGVCLPFDIYIFESTEGPDKDYREKSQAIVDQLGQDYGIVVATGKGDEARQFCDRAFVLDEGKVTYYEDIEAAIAHLEQIEEPAVIEFEEADGQDESDSEFDTM